MTALMSPVPARRVRRAFATLRRAARSRRCADPACRRWFQPREPQHVFCTPSCAALSRRRDATRGALLYRACLDWQSRRAKGGFGRVTRLLSGWRTEDSARRSAAEAAHPLPIAWSTHP